MHFTSLSVKIRRNFHIEIGGGGYREEINKTKTSGASYIFFHTTNDNIDIITMKQPHIIWQKEISLNTPMVSPQITRMGFILIFLLIGTIFQNTDSPLRFYSLGFEIPMPRIISYTSNRICYDLHNKRTRGDKIDFSGLKTFSIL